jgi:WD40 repeat protein
VKELQADILRLNFSEVSVWAVNTGECKSRNNRVPGLYMASSADRRQYLMKLAQAEITGDNYNRPTPTGRTLYHLTLWDVAKGFQRYLINKSLYDIACAAFSPDGKTVAFASKDRKVSFRNVATGAHRGTLPRTFAHTPAALTFSPDGRCLAVGTQDQVTIWELGKLEVLARLPVTGLNDLTFSPDGKRLLLSTSSGVQLWDPSAGNKAAVVGQDKSAVGSIEFAADGQRFVWMTLNGGDISVMDPNTAPIPNVAPKPDGKP